MSGWTHGEQIRPIRVRPPTFACLVASFVERIGQILSGRR